MHRPPSTLLRRRRRRAWYTSMPNGLAWISTCPAMRSRNRPTHRSSSTCTAVAGRPARRNCPCGSRLSWCRRDSPSLVSCHTSSGASARPTGSRGRATQVWRWRVPAGNDGPIAKGRNATTGPVGRALREFAMRATAALWSLPICPIFHPGSAWLGRRRRRGRSDSEAPGRLWGARIDAHGELKKRQNSRDTTLAPTTGSGRRRALRRWRRAQRMPSGGSSETPNSSAVTRTGYS